VEKRLKIAVDLTPMLPGGENGGVKFAVLELLRGLKKDFAERLTFLFLTANDSAEEVHSLLGSDDTALCVLGRRRGGWGRAIQAVELATRARLTVRKLMRHYQIDVLYCPFGGLPFASATVPTVALVVDLLHRDFPLSLPAQDREWRELNFRKLASYADHYQVISEFTGQRLQSLYKVPSNRIFRTYLPIHRRFSGSFRQNPSSPDFDRKPFFFYPANFWTHKNHEVLLIAYQLYLASLGDRAWDLVLTGHLDERARYLQRVARDLDISLRVKFLGHVPEATLGKLYSMASCLVFPSLYEGFGIPIVEAMSFSTPIVCSREASIPEIAGEAVLYANARNPLEFAAALRQITEDENLRKSLAERGEIQLRKFDFSAEVARLADVLIATASGKARHRKGSLSADLLNLVSEGTYFGRALGRQAFETMLKLQLKAGM
jgi:glycosyltransferase involved in cell wall biosynthesis